MSSLAYCIKKFKGRLSSYDIDQIKGYAAAYIKEGHSGPESNQGAVTDYIADLAKEREDVVSQIQVQVPGFVDDYKAADLPDVEAAPEAKAEAKVEPPAEEVEAVPEAKAEAEEPAKAGTKTKTVIDAIIPILRTWKNFPTVRVIQGVSEFDKKSRKIIADMERKRGGKVEGLYDPSTDTVVLIAENLSESRIEDVLRHEAEGHRGLRLLMGSSLDVFLDQLGKAKKAELLKANPGLNFNDEKAVRSAANEWAAQQVEAGTLDQTWTKRLVRAFKKWLRKFIPGLKLTDSEIETVLREVVVNVREGELQGVLPGLREAPQYAAALPVKTDAFKTWFGKSKVVDENGDPLVVYHGTSREFGAFEKAPQRTTGNQIDGFYFSQFEGTAEAYGHEWGETKKPIVMPVYVSLKNPKIYTNLEDFISGDRLSLEAEGFDGAIRKLDTGEMVEIVAFEPTQIKSTEATKFDPADPRIQFSTRTAEQQLDDFLLEFRRKNNGVTPPTTQEVSKSPSFQETLEPVTNDDYITNRKDSRNKKASAARGVQRVLSEVAEGIDKYLGSISTRLGKVSLRLKAKLRRLDFDINARSAEAVKAVEPLLRKAKEMNRDDFADWDYARKNSDVDKINELVAKYDMQKEYDAYREVLDDLRTNGRDVGLSIGEIDEYAPRILKDSRGFLKAIGKEEEWPIYSRMIKEKADALGMDVDKMTPDQKAEIISGMILGGWTGLGGVTAAKQRKLQKIPAYLNRYYMDSDAALVQHIHSMTNAIESRKFFGKIPEKVAKMRGRLHAAQSKIRELNKLLAGKPEGADKIRKRRNKWIGREKQYSEYISMYAMQRDYTENISAYILELIESKEILPRHERVVNEILNARFHEKGTRGVVQAYKNLSYIDTMGSPISALTQIGDMAWAAYEGGLIKAIKYGALAAVGKSRITKEDVGVVRVAQEFADPGTMGNMVTKVFKITGLEKIDSIGKEALLNTALEKYQKRARNDTAKLKRELRPVFEGETDSVIEDLLNDEITENVKLLVYSRLLDFQPVGLSEMPQKYLDAGNGRLFYMLKTFTIKVFDVFRNEAFGKIRNGTRAEKIEGLRNLVVLSMFFVLANAGADELKDLVLGRKTDLEDRVVDNILRLFGVSKFVTWKARTEGVGSALARQILPPFKFLDSLSKDIITAGDEKGLEVLGSVPVVGKLAYWHIGRGVHKRGDLWDRRLKKHKSKLRKVSEGLEKSKDKNAFRVKHRQDLVRIQQVNKLQGRLNKLRKTINQLKSLEDTPSRKTRIRKLEESRTKLIRQFLRNK